MLRGLDGSIVKPRRARRSYGFMLPTPFQASKGWDAYMYWESSYERYMVDGHLDWCVTRVASSLPITPDYMGKGKANNGNNWGEEPRPREE